MTFQDILKPLLTLLSGGALWELIKFISPDIKKWISDKKNSKKLILDFIDPLLKSGDELIGKIHSLAKTDFKDAYTVSLNNSSNELLIERIYLLYLFCCFWGRIALIRQTTNFSSVSKSKVGNKFLKFLSTFESKKNRLISRASQRVIGDALVSNDKKAGIISLFDFTLELTKVDSNLLKLIRPLEEIIHNANDKKTRQKILLFGIVLQVFLDSFDPEHHISRKRPLYLNKLTPETKKDLERRLFTIYLPFIKEPSRYYR
jgi:hypothetical protein